MSTISLDPSSLEAIKRAVTQGIEEGLGGAGAGGAGAGGAGGGGGGAGGAGGAGAPPPAGGPTITDADIARIEQYRDNLLQMKQTDAVRVQIQASELQIAKKRLKQALDSSTASEDELRILQEIVEEEEEKLKNIKQANSEREKGLATLRKIGKEVAGSMQIFKQHPFFNVGKIMEVAGALKGAGVKGVLAFVGSLATGVLTSFLNNMIGLMFELDEAESKFKKATGASASFAREMTNSYERNRLNTVSITATREAWTELYTGMSTFTMISAEARAEVGDMVAVLAGQGVALSDAAAGLETFTKMMGQTATTAAQSLSEISALAVDLGVAPSQMAADFAKIGPQLAALGADGEKAFKDLARASKNTGLEMTKLLSITSKFDTFEGAAEAAGSLNAALGGNFVNAMDLMQETDPVERFSMIRGAIEDAGLSFDDMSYYQRQFYANALGLDSVGDLALALSGDMSALGDEVGMTSADYEDQAQRTQQLATLTEKFKAIIAALTPTLMPLLDKLHEWADSFLQNENAINQLQQKVESFLQPFKALGDILGHLIRNWPIYLGILVTYKVLMMILSGIISAKALAERAAAASTNLAKTATIRQLAAMKRAVPVFLAMGAAILMIGGAFFLAALGASLLAESLKGMSGGEMVALVVILVLLGVGIFFLAKMMLGATIPAAGFATAMIGLGFAIMLVGAGIAIAAFGMAFLVEKIGEAGAGPLLAFAAGMWAMSLALGALNLALMSLANPLTLTGMSALGALLVTMGWSMGILVGLLAILMVPLGAVLEAMTNLANTDMSGLGNVFASIATSMMGMSTIKLWKAARMIRASEDALIAAKAAGFGVGAQRVDPIGGGGGPGGGGTQRARTQQVPRITIPITLELDGDKFAETVVDVVDQAGYEAATGRT